MNRNCVPDVTARSTLSFHVRELPYRPKRAGRAGERGKYKMSGTKKRKHIYLVKFVPKLCDNSELGVTYRAVSEKGAKIMFRKEWPKYKILSVHILK